MSKTLEERLSELEERMTALEAVREISGDTKTSTAASMKKMSAKEFLLTKTFKSEVEKALVLAYYLEHMTALSSFNVDDVVEIFRAAKEKKPLNPSDVVAKNAARGFVMEAAEKKGGKKAWVLTSTGERYVENELSN